MIWFGFILTAAVIVIAGSKLCVLAEKLAKDFHISSSAIGLLLVSIITSLPELSTSLGAVLKVGRPDLSVGNNLGSDLFNLMIIALCDLLFRRGGMLRQIHSKTGPLLCYLVMLAGILLTLLLPNRIVFMGARFNIGSLIVIAFYLITFLRNHRSGQVPLSESDWVESNPPDRRKKTIFQFAVASVVIVISGVVLAQLGDQIAERTGLEQSFIGTLLLALATSLPELTVSITALKTGSIDLMMGNLVGSNMFNVLVTAIADLAYRKEALHIPDNVNPGLLIPGGCAALMVGVVMLAMRQKKKARWVAWESVAMILIYLTALFALYRIA
jgi:cation:H+ antiporter